MILFLSLLLNVFTDLTHILKPLRNAGSVRVQCTRLDPIIVKDVPIKRVRTPTVRVSDDLIFCCVNVFFSKY